MANHFGTALSRLIREHAYRAGDLKKLERQEAAARERLNDATRTLRAVKQRRRDTLARLDQLNVEISNLAVIDTALIRAIRDTPRLGHFEHGEFTSELVRLLKGLNRPAPTRSIVGAMVACFGFPFDSPAERDAARRRVVERLRVLAKKGAIKRLHSPDSNKEGCWIWVGL